MTTVLIVGAGFGGIGAGVTCKKNGIDFLIVERSAGVGGTWWDNRYPGAEVDVPSHVYSYSFKRFDWTRTHARQAELQGYLEEVVTDFGLSERLRLGVSVEQAIWSEERAMWEVRLSDCSTVTCNVLVSAVGFLNEPNMPNWPGIDTFEGEIFHTSRWPADLDLTGKRVAVIGTGSTACQLIPEVAEAAEKLYVFQREPGWVMPKGEREYSPEERRRNRNRFRHRWNRVKGFIEFERNIYHGSFRLDGKTSLARAEAARKYIEDQFQDMPELQKAVTPTYPYPGKRPIYASGYYPALRRENVELVTRAVESLSAREVVDVLGERREVDVVVMSTGFSAANYLPTLNVIGRGGRSLHAHWDGEPQAMLGVTVPGFPNFVMLYGPGTNGFEIVSNLLRQGRYAVRIARLIRRGKCRAVDVSSLWCDLYNVWLHHSVQNTSWVHSNNYYKSRSGRIVTQWPYGALAYAALLRTLAPLSERRT